MTTQTMIQPSSLLPDGIQITLVDNHYLFKFTDELNQRMIFLLDKKKQEILSSSEEAEYAGISELDRIFTLINSMMIAQK